MPTFFCTESTEACTSSNYGNTVDGEADKKEILQHDLIEEININRTPDISQNDRNTEGGVICVEIMAHSRHLKSHKTRKVTVLGLTSVIYVEMRPALNISRLINWHILGRNLTSVMYVPIAVHIMGISVDINSNIQGRNLTRVIYVTLPLHSLDISSQTKTFRRKTFQVWWMWL